MKLTVFLTERWDGKRWLADAVQALTWREAEMICRIRNQGEKVVGELVEYVEVEE